MHNPFVRPFGQWYAVTVPTARDMRTLDRLASQALDGDGGGLHTPRTPIGIGGAGLQATQADVRGGIATRRGGRRRHGDNDVDTFEKPRARTLRMPLMEGRDHDSAVLLGTFEPVLDGIRTRVPGAVLAVVIPGPYLHQGATLARVTLRYRVGAPHAAVPASPLHFTVARANAAGTLTTLAPFLPGWQAATPKNAGERIGPSSGMAYVATTTGVTGAIDPTWPIAVGATVLDGTVVWRCIGSLGWERPAPSPAAHDAGGALKAVDLTPLDNATVDHAAFRYLVEIQDEGGVGAQAGNVFHALELEFSQIADVRFP